MYVYETRNTNVVDIDSVSLLVDSVTWSVWSLILPAGLLTSEEIILMGKDTNKTRSYIQYNTVNVSKDVVHLYTVILNWALRTVVLLYVCMVRLLSWTCMWGDLQTKNTVIQDARWYRVLYPYLTCVYIASICPFCLVPLTSLCQSYNV